MFSPLFFSKKEKSLFELEFIFLITSSLDNLFKTQIAPAEQTGFPPKVEPWSEGLKVSLSFSSHNTAPIGSPPPSPLAIVTIFGFKL
jgi:hypothetical protein